MPRPATPSSVSSRELTGLAVFALKSPMGDEFRNYINIFRLHRKRFSVNCRGDGVNRGCRADEARPTPPDFFLSHGNSQRPLKKYRRPDLPFAGAGLLVYNASYTFQPRHLSHMVLVGMPNMISVGKSGRAQVRVGILVIAKIRLGRGVPGKTRRFHLSAGTWVYRLCRRFCRHSWRTCRRGSVGGVRWRRGTRGRAGWRVRRRG